jgi:hypothetical protein
MSQNKKQLFEAMDPILNIMDQDQLTMTYTLLHNITMYIQNEEGIETTQILGLLRNITSNILLLNYYFDSRVSSKASES